MNFANEIESISFRKEDMDFVKCLEDMEKLKKKIYEKYVPKILLNQYQSSIKCDRCNEISHGQYYKDWSRFIKEKERIICHNCMHSDPNYIAIYGKRRT